MGHITNIIGYLAATSLCITLLPQLYHTYKLKKVDDLSYIFIFLQIVTCVLFLIYGILLYEATLILANSLVLSQILLLLIFKKIYTNQLT